MSTARIALGLAEADDRAPELGLCLLREDSMEFLCLACSVLYAGV
jgi:hypothetical protein